MTGIESNFPFELDIFPQLLDGFHPDVPEDWNHLTNTIAKVQELLGLNPSGSAPDVATRVGQFIDDDGFLQGMRLVITTINVAAFSTLGSGLTVTWDTFPTNNFTPIITSLAQERGGSAWERSTIDTAWIISRTAASATWKSYYRDGAAINLNDQIDILFAVLAVHDEITI